MDRARAREREGEKERERTQKDNERKDRITHIAGTQHGVTQLVRMLLEVRHKAVQLKEPADTRTQTHKTLLACASPGTRHGSRETHCAADEKGQRPHS